MPTEIESWIERMREIERAAHTEMRVGMVGSATRASTSARNALPLLLDVVENAAKLAEAIHTEHNDNAAVAAEALFLSLDKLTKGTT